LLCINRQRISLHWPARVSGHYGNMIDRSNNSCTDRAVRSPQRMEFLATAAPFPLNYRDPMNDRLRTALASGLVIPAHPLALTADRRLDEVRQRALSRYYLAAGAGGLAVGVHT